jgi:hypothetical protein
VCWPHSGEPGNSRSSDRPLVCWASSAPQKQKTAISELAGSDAPLRGVEVRGSARFIDEGVTEVARRIAARYLDEDEAAADAEALRGTDVIIRIEPGELRIWDFADEF